MSDRKIKVPEGMMLAVQNKARVDGRALNPRILRSDLEAALIWLSENPIVPTEKQYGECLRAVDGPDKIVIHVYREGEPQKVLAEWQRRMFLAPEVPEAIKDLLSDDEDEGRGILFGVSSDVYNQKLVEAYRRGQQAKEVQ